MEVSISVPGQFHAFKLGDQLLRRSALKRIYTTMPAFALNDEGIPSPYITHIRYPEAILYLDGYLPDWSYLPSMVTWKNRLFDRSVARRVTETDSGVFVGFAGCCRRTIRAANRSGWTTVVERSSAHVRTQAKLLNEERRRWGIDEPIKSEAAIRQEEAEYERADYISTPSTFVYESFLDQGYPEEKLLQIPLGVETEGFEPAEEPPETFRCVFVGHVGVRKGVKYLLEAWTSLDLEDAELVVASDADARGRELIDEYGSYDDIEFRGYVDDLPEFYRSASVFAFPSIEDGFGRVVAEALASGLPAIVSENTGAKDLVEDGSNGFVVPIADSESIAEKLQLLYDSESLRRKMRTAARESVVGRYTWDDYGDRVWKEYSRIVD